MGQKLGHNTEPERIVCDLDNLEIGVDWSEGILPSAKEWQQKHSTVALEDLGLQQLLLLLCFISVDENG